MILLHQHDADHPADLTVGRQEVLVRFRQKYMHVGQTFTTGISKNGVIYFKIGSKRIGVLALHLKSKRGGEKSTKQRTAQARVAQKITRNEIVAKGCTPIVVGALNYEDADVKDRQNTVPLSNAIKLIKDYDPSTSGKELRNTGSKIPRKADRHTHQFDVNRSSQIEAGEKLTMIDIVLVHQNMWNTDRHVFVDHGHGARMSNHWPVIVDLVIE